MDFSWLGYYRVNFTWQYSTRGHPESMYPGRRGALIEPKWYIYCFGGIIIFLKYVQEERGLKYLSYLSVHTL